MAIQEDKVVSLLGQGYPMSVVASVIGCTQSALNQLLEEKPNLKNQVTKLSLERLARTQNLDDSYDEIEETLLNKLKNSLVFVTEPKAITAILTRINAAKRRGQLSSDATGLDKSEVVRISLPTVIVNQFLVNGNNQVVQAGDQTLVTMPSGGITGLVEKQNELKRIENKSG